MGVVQESHTKYSPCCRWIAQALGPRNDKTLFLEIKPGLPGQLLFFQKRTFFFLHIIEILEFLSGWTLTSRESPRPGTANVAVS